MPYSFPIDPDRSSRARRRAKAEGLEVKGLGARIGDVRFDPNAEDGDGDGLVQDSSAYERPAVPKVPQAFTGKPVTTAQGSKKRQEELTPDEVRDIDAVRESRTAVAGLRSAVSKPTGGLVPPIPMNETIGVNGKPSVQRDILPDLSIPQPISLDWLRDMSDAEIAEALVPRSIEDYAAMVMQHSHRHLMIGAELTDDASTNIFIAADTLESLGAPDELVQKLRDYAGQRYTRQGKVSAESLFEEMTEWHLKNKDKINTSAEMDLINTERGLFSIAQYEQELEAVLEERMDFVLEYINKNKVSWGLDFSEEAREEAKKIIERALSESESFAWAVRTYGLPPIRLVTQRAHDRAKTHPMGDIRDEPLKEHAGGWFSHVDTITYGIALNMSDRNFAADSPRGALNFVEVAPVGNFPTHPIPNNISFAQPDVLMHEWGHFFYFIFTRRENEGLFLSAGWDASEYRTMVKQISRRYNSKKGDIFKRTSNLRIRARLTALDFLNHIVDVNELISAGVEDPEDVTKNLVKFLNGITPKLKELNIAPSTFSGFAIGPDGRLTPESDNVLNKLLSHTSPSKKNPDEQVITASTISGDNPMFNPWFAQAQMNAGGRQTPLTMSVYGLTNPQENWAEGVIAFLSPSASARAQNNNAKRMEIARTLGLSEKNGKHDKPWTRQSSGLRSSTEMNPYREVLKGDVVGMGEGPESAERLEKIDAIEEISYYERFQRALNAPQERIDRLREIMEDIAVSDFKTDDIVEMLTEVREQLAQMVRNGLFAIGSDEKRSPDTQDHTLYQDAVERIARVFREAIMRDIDKEERLQELDGLMDAWELGLNRQATQYAEEIQNAGLRARGMASSTKPQLKLNQSYGIQGFEDFIQIIANGKKPDGTYLSEEEYENLRKKPGYRELLDFVDNFKKKFDEKVKAYNSLPSGEKKEQDLEEINQMRADFRSQITEVVESRFKELLDNENNNIFIQVDTKALVNILNIGRFLTIFDNDAVDAIGGGGDSSVNRRLMYELEMFGVPEDSDTRPVYGYLWNDEIGAVSKKDEKSFEILDRRASLWNYGGISVRLKKNIRERTTVTANDSLAGYSVISPVYLDEPDISGVGLFADWVMSADDVTDVNTGNVPYIETQIHGGVSLDDIEEIVVPQVLSDLASKNPDDYPEYQDDFTDIARGQVEDAIALFDAFKKSNIKVRLI